MLQLNIDLKKLENARVNVDINLINFSGEKSSKMINGIKIGLGMSAGYIIMMFIIIYGAMVMRSVIEEKTSRIIEVIISSVKPFELMIFLFRALSIARFASVSLYLHNTRFSITDSTKPFVDRMECSISIGVIKPSSWSDLLRRIGAVRT